MTRWQALPGVQVSIDADSVQGPLEMWRHTAGHGGINSLPLPDGVVEGAALLKPRLTRIFLQEFFRIYPAHGRFDWSRLDPYMASFARTGTKICAAICIKPQPLYPKIDATIWQPSDWKEWQQVIAALVRRYSIEQPLVTHWEIGNEVDIGEDGGCPYLIRNGEEYGEYYSRTIRPILEVYPQANVGGPANAYLLNEPLPGWLKYCRRTGAQVDFISWHLYHSDASLHLFQAAAADTLCRELLGRRPEFFITEWNRRLGGATEDVSYDARRAAAAAAIILDMRRAKIDASFYYHLWDQTCFADDFAPFFSPAGVTNMIRHWNEIPHRLGLFGVDGDVRPQYFVYRMLTQMGQDQLAARSDDRDIRVLAGRTGERICALAVNYSLDEQGDRVATFRFSHLAPGVKDLAVYRVDQDRHWSAQTLDLLPVEHRRTYVPAEFFCQVHLPADSVAMVSLTNAP
jgi:xylan 1,4-beta-xylosidase